MVALAVLAPYAVLSSGLPILVSGPLAVLAVFVALGCALRELRRSAHTVVVDAAGTVTVDAQAVEGFKVVWRGTLGFVSWRDAAGRSHRRSLWPDTLTPALRRELRLAVRDGGDGQAPPSMAP